MSAAVMEHTVNRADRLRRPVAGGLCLVLACSVAQATAKPGAGPAPARVNAGAVPPGMTSVIVRLERDKKSFSDLLSKSLAPQLKKLKETFRRNVRDAVVLHEQLQSDPRNRRIAAAYEEKLSAALVQAKTFLDEFDALKEPTFEALAEVAKSVETARTGFRTHAAASTKQAREYRAKADKAREKLAALARSFAIQLKRGDALPASVDAHVRCLEVDRATAVQSARLAEVMGAKATETVALLGAKLDELARLHGILQVSFAQAMGQSMLITQVGVHRQRLVQARRLFDSVTPLSGVVQVKQDEIDKMAKAIGELADTALGSPSESAAMAKAGVGQDEQASARILRRYLNEKNKEAAHVSNQPQN